jgi:hypothetical protein
LGLVIYPLVLIVLIWPFGPPSLRLVVTLAAAVFFASTAVMRREPDSETVTLWENVWAAVGILAVALAVGGSLLAFVLGAG